MPEAAIAAHRCLSAVEARRILEHKDTAGVKTGHQKSEALARWCVNMGNLEELR